MNSSATDKPFQTALEAALTMLAREQPEAYRALCAELGRTSIDARVDRERVRINGSGSALAVVTLSTPSAPPTPDAIWVASDLRTIDDLLDGHTTLLDVVWNDRVVLRAGLEQLLRAHDALIVFLRAAVRCPSAPELLRTFREAVRRSSAAPAAPATPDRESSAA